MMSIKTIVQAFTTPLGERFSVAWVVDGIPKGERIFDRLNEAEAFARGLKNE